MDGGKKAKYMVYTEQVWPANSDKLLIKTELKWLVIEFYKKKKRPFPFKRKHLLYLTLSDDKLGAQYI